MSSPSLFFAQLYVLSMMPCGMGCPFGRSAGVICPSCVHFVHPYPEVILAVIWKTNIIPAKTSTSGNNKDLVI